MMTDIRRNALRLLRPTIYDLGKRQLARDF
jgi:hypothetical protein